MDKNDSWFVISNPCSGGGAGKRKWPAVKAILEAQGLRCDHAVTEFPGHAKELVYSAVYQGFQKFICVGGDGTLHEMVNALMVQNHTDKNRISLGLIPIGTGNDWARQYAIPKRIEEAVKRICKGKTVLQDIGKIQLATNPENPIYFNNLCGVGFDGHVVQKVHRYKYLGAGAYLIGALLGLLSHNNFPVHLNYNKETHDGRVLMVVFGIGKFSGGGMQLTDQPSPADGYIDMSIAGDLKWWQVIRLTPKLFNGNITSLKHITTAKIKEASIEVSRDYDPLIEADGEIIGRGSFNVSIEREALRFYI